VLCHLNRFKAYQNLVITDRQPEHRTPPITLSAETTAPSPVNRRLAPVPADDPSDVRSAFGGPPEEPHPTPIMQQVRRRASAVQPPHDPRTPDHNAATGKPHDHLEIHYLTRRAERSVVLVRPRSAAGLRADRRGVLCRVPVGHADLLRRRLVAGNPGHADRD